MHESQKTLVTQQQVRVSCAEELLHKPWKFDWFQVMRRLEAQNKEFPRLGMALHPEQEPVRVGQKPALTFASAVLTNTRINEKGKLRIEQAGFGLFGPNGPLPLHITEYVRERIAYDDDMALGEFSNIFHHRFGLIFYRVWANAQPANSLDRPDEDRFAEYVGAIIGYLGKYFYSQDAVQDHAKRYFSGHLVRQTRNPEGIRSILQECFACDIRVEEWVPQWLKLEEGERTRLGRLATAEKLGEGAVCGTAVLDRQYRFRLHAGPLNLHQYIQLLPGTHANRRLRDWVRNYVGYEFQWDLCLILKHADVPELNLGSTVQLGWTTWLGAGAEKKDRDDLILDLEKMASV